ncbi:MAG: hypothetical protein QOD39_4015, partial [Mycobacterium sp.]|nr:hypothetical protein [Mycobacterium sp.]
MHDTDFPEVGKRIAAGLDDMTAGLN